MTTDIFQMISSLDAEGIQRVVDRLEYRGKDDFFVAMRETYLNRMEIGPTTRVLDLGCGTGIVARALAARASFPRRIVGIDYSGELIGAAKRLAREEGIGERVEFRVGDGASLDDDEATFDVVILHTLVSHVPNPDAVIAEAGRVVRPGGTVVIFDGDYASLAMTTGNHENDVRMVQAILAAIVANPYVMRQVPSIIQKVKLQLEDFLPHVLAEAGEVTFFANMAESYVPMVVRAQLMSEDKATDWLDAYRKSAAHSNSFGSCNYCTYLIRRPT